ncbi:MAG: tail fiber domain-containing protein [Pedosphaera sp.]|nr:tail fiber domain-containing protein [Pedosphaera sp.]
MDTNYDGLLVQSTATNGNGMHGLANIGLEAYGVFGEAFDGFGVVGSGGRYGMYAYSSNGFALFAQSSGGPVAPQLVLLQDNPADRCRLRMGSSGWPQWNIAVASGATPRMEFYNGATNVMWVDYLGNLSAKTFVTISDLNLKENFDAPDVREVLARVEKLPIQTWNFKDEGGVRHIGPMAQDFHAAFKVGEDDKRIATVDADGVALAAIQGLNQVVKEKEARITALEKRLGELEKLVGALAAKR